MGILCGSLTTVSLTPKQTTHQFSGSYPTLTWMPQLIRSFITCGGTNKNEPHTWKAKDMTPYPQCYHYAVTLKDSYQKSPRDLLQWILHSHCGTDTRLHVHPPCACYWHLMFPDPAEVGSMLQERACSRKRAQSGVLPRQRCWPLWVSVCKEKWLY